MANTSSTQDASTETLLANRAPPPARDKPVPKLPSKTIRDRIREQGWWWETGAVIVSFICMSLLVAILFVMNGNPLRLWTLPIQPNSLVSVFSTITRSSLLVPIAESIGQLKWDYFSRPRNIRSMQIFDEASRGPWGAFVFLWRTRGNALLATFGAIITVLMLGFEPFTQQIIELHTQKTVLLNTTGFVASTTSFTNAALVGKIDFPQDLSYQMAAGLLASILDQPVTMPNNSYCPTLGCDVNDYTSLAVHEFCETQDINFSKDSEYCYYQLMAGIPKNITLSVFEDRAAIGLLPNRTISERMTLHIDFKAAAAEAEEGSVWVRECSILQDFDDHTAFNLRYQVTPQYEGSRLHSGEVLISRNETEFVLFEEPDNGTWHRTMELTYGPVNSNGPIGTNYLLWSTSSSMWTPETTPGSDTIIRDERGDPKERLSGCIFASDLETTVLDGETNLPEITTIMVPTCFTSTSDLIAMQRLDRFGDMSGTFTKCRPSICARHYSNVSIGGSSKRTANTIDVPLNVSRSLIDDDPQNPVPYEANDDQGNRFFLDRAAAMVLWRFFSTTITSETYRSLLARNLPKKGGDWSHLWGHFSDVLTQAVQSQSNPNATLLHGNAYGTEIFVRVRWAWFILPLSLVLASNIFWYLTVYHSRKSPYLYKNSVMAILFHGLEGWEAYELAPAKKAGRETYHDIMDTSTRMRASLRRNSDGVLKLKKD